MTERLSTSYQLSKKLLHQHCKTWLLLAALFCCSAAWAQTSERREFWYGAAFDHRDSGVTVRLFEANETHYVRQLDLKLLDITPPQGIPEQIGGERFYAATALPEHRLIVDHLLRRAIFIRKQMPHLSSAPSQDLLLMVTANGERIAEPLYFRYQAGELILPEATMRALGVAPHKVWQQGLEGAMPLHALAGESFVVDYERLSLETRLLPEVLRTSRVNVTERRTALPPLATGQSRATRPSAILNYDVTAGTDSRNEAWHAGFYELSVGQGRSQCQTQYLDTSEDSWQRVNTYCQRDWPDRRLTATLGDALGTGGALAQPWGYTGIHIGTDFALQPSLLTIPARSITGIVDQPSTVEIWIDDALNYRQDIPAGPFELNNIPLRTGAGELTAFITPAFGQQQYFAYEFYVDRSLLAPGLNDWSLEAGKLRSRAFGGDNHYGEEFVSGQIRRGLHRRLTMGFGFQATETLTVANASAAFVVSDWLAIDSSVATSRQQRELSDLAWQARISHESQWLNVSYQLSRKPVNYHDLARLTGTSAPEETRQLSVGMPLGHGATFNYNQIYRKYNSGLELGLKTAGFTLRLGDVGSLRLSAARTDHNASETIYGAHLTLPFGSSHNASFSSNTEGSRHWQSASLQKNLPSGPGYGYLADFSTGAPYQRGTLSFDAQGSAGRLSLRGDSFDGEQRGSLGASGSILASAEGLDLSRRTQGSYAVVDVGVADVPVYHGGQLKAYTNAQGSALVPGLRPFETNLIKIRAEDVPLDVQPETLSMTITPGRREVTKVNFAFKRERYFSGTLEPAAKDASIPAGANVSVDGAPVTVVGQNGAFFIGSQGNTFSFTVDTSHGVCTVFVNAASNGQGIVTDLGTLLCE